MREFFVNVESDSNDADDVTGHVPKYVPKDIFKLAIATNENILVVLSSEEQNCLYVYQYLLTIDKNYNQAWFKWSFVILLITKY